MVVVGGWTAARRIAHGPGTGVLFRYATLAVLAAGVVVLVPVFVFVIRPPLWYEARLLIPISGMILSNAMNGVALVFERVFASIHDDAPAVEQLLSLGATPKQAVERHVRAAMNAALRPTINGLLTVGLVALPGMMTGQIVSGTAPRTRRCAISWSSCTSWSRWPPWPARSPPGSRAGCHSPTGNSSARSPIAGCAKLPAR